MFEGKMLRVATGTPMRRMERANISLADAEPEPFTLANFTTKSLTALIGLDMAACLGRIEEELLHVPGPGWAAFRAEAAVQAQILILHHNAPGLEGIREVEVLGGCMGGWRHEAGPELFLLAVHREGDAVHWADIDAGVALDALRSFE